MRIDGSGYEKNVRVKVNRTAKAGRDKRFWAKSVVKRLKTNRAFGSSTIWGIGQTLEVLSSCQTIVLLR